MAQPKRNLKTPIAVSIRIFLKLALLCLSGVAQEPKMVETEFITIALDESVDGLFYSNEKSVEPFQANLTGLSQPMRYKGPQRFVVRATADEFTAAPPLPAPAASVVLPLNCKRVLLTCIQSDDKPLRIVAYDISTDNRAGDYRFFNFSRKPLSLILEGKRFAVSPGKDTSVSNDAWRNSVHDLPVQVAAVENNKPKLVYSSVWGHRPGRRNFIFMFDGHHPSKPINICRFFDIPATAKASAP
jgi:hypothetical protein